MFVNFRKRHRFTNDETINIELFAHQAAVAIDNAYMFEQQTVLYNQQKRHLAALEALYNAGRAFSGTLDLDEILDHVAEQAYQLALPAGEHTHFSYVKWVENGKIYLKNTYPRNKLDKAKKKVLVIDLEKDLPIGISGRWQSPAWQPWWATPAKTVIISPSTRRICPRLPCRSRSIKRS